MSKVIAVNSVFPANSYSQDEIFSLLRKTWPEHAGVLDRLRQSSGVESRNLLLPLERYAKLGGFGERNGAYIEGVLELLERSVRGLHAKTEFPWEDVAAIFSTTITGIAVPSLDARLMNRFPIPKNAVRVPLFGLGCLGGVATLNRAHDYLKAYPEKLVLVLAAEACSLTFQFDDTSMANFVATSLFGDGSAAVLLAGDQHPLARDSKFEILGGASSFYRNTERIMGWDLVDTGFKIVLSGDVPEIVRTYVGDDVASFLAERGLVLKDIRNIVSHPGGPKVLRALSEVLGKPESAFVHSWDSLRERGNLSSVSVLNVLQRSLVAGTLVGGYGLAAAMGPAFNSELLLFRTVT